MVTSVGVNTLVVDIISGKSMPKGKTYKHSQCIMVKKQSQSAAPKTGRKAPDDEKKAPEEEPAKHALNEELSDEAAKDLAASIFDL